ncbi:MAG: hypothetical protein IJ718_01890 [Paludibacteraceae bacterium]|nr:hypothetical protein [Paludibacteraceae bacterium]
MHTIIKKIVKLQGQNVITSKTLVNCIDDEGGFSDVEKRPYKKILKLIIEEGYSRKLLDIGAWNAEAEMLARTCAQRSLIQEEGVLYVFACLAYGLGWLSKAPKVPAEVKKIKQQEAKKKAEENEAARKKAETESRQKEEAARKKAEIAEKRALEAERRAKDAEKKALEAEEARKKSEREAKDKADKQAAEEVIRLIKNIGAIECTEECRAKVSAALQAYKKLTSSQQVLVDQQVGTALQRMADETKKIAEEAARKKAEEKSKEIESILLKYCRKKGSSLTEYYREHAEYDMPRNRYDEIYDYVLKQNKQLGAYKYCLPLGDYDYYFHATDNKSFGISVCRKINEDGLWNQHEKKTKIGHIDKVFKIGFVILWAFFLIINAIYTWVANSWLSCIIWVIITVVVFYCLMVLLDKASEESPIETKSPDSGTIAHLAWRICWVLGLSVISEIIMIVIFAS